MADKEKNRREVLNRARNNIIRLVNCNPDLMTFITLTYKKNMKDLKRSKADLNECIQELQRDFPGFKYLYVLEFQQRGSVHYHMICNLPVPVETAKTKEFKPEGQKLLERQFHDTYWEHGFCDIRDLSQEGNTNAGLYVAVYLIEDLFEIDLKGTRCYGYSRNLTKPIERTMLTEKKPYEVPTSFEGYDLKYASSYNMQYESDKETIKSQINYFDMCRTK